MDSTPAIAVNGTRATSTARPVLLAISAGRRRLRSNHTPANSDNTIGAYRATLSRPIWNGVACSVTTATSTRPNSVTWAPARATVSPPQNLTKSLFRNRSGTDRSHELDVPGLLQPERLVQGTRGFVHIGCKNVTRH